MTDRELLEKAAKAAGLKLQPAGRTDGSFLVLMNEDGDYIWSPLTDDGDAFRLAVKLQIHVQPSGRYTWASTFSVNATEDATGDPYAATRLAIVRAAAQMAKDGE
jgi:hypothetical protein